MDAKQQIKFITKNLHKLVRNLPSEHYHGLKGTWSSSQFKDILDDEEVFIQKHVKKEIAKESNEAFDTGTYLHTSILEPHKVAAEIVVFEGKVRYGSKWTAFKKENVGKVILTATQKEQGDMMANCVRNSPVAMEYLVGDPEVSLFIELSIYHGRIYAPFFGKVLTRNGWQSVKFPKEVETKGHHIIVKVRADCLGENFISDLKSTSGNARSEESVRGSISKYKYDLSASLYLDMFSLVRPSVKEFVWIFASKTSRNAGSWRATTNQILVGRAKYMKAMIKLADCAMANWELVDCLREAEPLPWEREWLQEKETDLL